MFLMIGAIIGDVIGSVYENQNTQTENFPLFSRFSRFTEDTILTVAIADAILHRKVHPIPFVERKLNSELYMENLRAYARKFPNAGYGQLFDKWALSSSRRGYRSYGNGSAMRVSPIGFAFSSLDQVLTEAKLSAQVTHNHPDGIKGAQAVASAVFLARNGRTKDEIRDFIQQRFNYDLRQRLKIIRVNYKFDSSCKGSVPQAIRAFLESTSFEDAIRKAISLGGDSDTLACMAGGISQAYYKNIPSALLAETNMLLDSSMKKVIRAFNEKFSVAYADPLTI
jgi:ADP-ribosylglycohydrolase